MRRRNSAAERQVPMIEQCTLGCRSESGVRRFAAGGAGTANSSAPRSFNEIRPPSAAAPGGRSVENTFKRKSGARDDMAARYIQQDIATIAWILAFEKRVRRQGAGPSGSPISSLIEARRLRAKWD